MGNRLNTNRAIDRNYASYPLQQLIDFAEMDEKNAISDSNLCRPLLFLPVQQLLSRPNIVSYHSHFNRH
jgi:hypothetical protein